MQILLLKTSAFDFSSIFGNILSKWYYYLILVVVLTIIAVVFTIKKTNKRNNLSKTQKLVYTAFFSALSFIANYFTIKISDAFQISLIASVGFISGYLLGGGLGFASAFIGDLICGIVAPFGAYNPIIGIGSGLFGLVPGLIFTFSNFNDYVNTVISFALTFVLCSFLINTLGLSLMYSMTFISLLSLLPFKFLTCFVNAVLCVVLIPLFPKILPKDKFLIYREKESQQ